jgi:uncharacterized lipoprotein YmbA
MGHQSSIIDYLSKVGEANKLKIYQNSDYRYSREWQKRFAAILSYMVKNEILVKKGENLWGLSEKYIAENPNKIKD